MPTVRAFTDYLDPELQPWLTAVDVVGSELYVRLMGGKAVELWGIDLTGVELNSRFGAEVMEAVYGPTQFLHQHVCGYRELKTALTSSGLELKLERLVVPVKKENGEGLRVVAVNAPLETTGYDPDHLETLKLSKVFARQWVDLGQGIPDVELNLFDADQWRADGGTIIFDAETV